MITQSSFFCSLFNSCKIIAAFCITIVVLFFCFNLFIYLFIFFIIIMIFLYIYFLFLFCAVFVKCGCKIILAHITLQVKCVDGTT